MGTKRNMRNNGILIIVGLLLAILTGSVSGQAILTPTPDADGNMFYIIQSNDSCMSISLKMGIDMQTLRELSETEAKLIREKEINRVALSSVAGKIGKITWREVNVG